MTLLPLFLSPLGPLRFFNDYRTYFRIYQEKLLGSSHFFLKSLNAHHMFLLWGCVSMNLTTVIVSAIGLLFILGAIAQIQLSHILSTWQKEIRRLTADGFRHDPILPWLRQTLDEYRTHRLAGTEVNTQALIEKNLFKEKIWLAGLMRAPIGNAAKMLAYLPSFTIILGVLGTFLGLTLSMYSMQNTLLSLGQTSGSSNLSVDAIIAAISSPFKGMSLAFITSIAGIGTAFLLNLLQAGFLSGGHSISYLVAKLFAECESLLDHQFETQLSVEKPQDSFEKILDRLATRIGESFHETIGDFGRGMVHFTKQLDQSMEELKALLEHQRAHTTAFSNATDRLKASGAAFEKATKLFDETNRGASAQIKTLKETIDRAFNRAEAHEKQMAKATAQTQAFIERSDKKAEELSRAYLQALEAQMQGFHDKYDHAAAALQRQQEDWLYQHQELNNHYAQASDSFSTSIDQLERSLYQMFEKVKRDILDQIKYQNERQAQLKNQDDRRGEWRDLIRGIDNLSHGMDRQFGDSQRYLQEFYHLLNRIAQLIEQQALGNTSPGPRTLPSRVIDS